MTTKKVNHLSVIQAELKAPKGQFNNFGKYKYRSCEDIVEAVKPLLAKVGGTLTISDDIRAVGDRVYVEAIAKITIDGIDYITHGFAREADTKKGMDVSQITGAASSYARKYALNGLLAIDDTKDADVPVETPKPVPEVIAQFAAVDSIDGLHKLWEKTENRGLYTQFKDAAKERLGNA